MMAISATLLLTGCLIQGVLSAFTIVLPQRVEALQGSCVFIPCTFDIDPQYNGGLNGSTKRIWYKEGVPTVVFDSSVSDTRHYRGKILGTPTEKICTTRFDNVNQSLNGSYFFRLEGTKGLIYSYRAPPHSHVEIVVLESPPKPTVSLFQDQVMEGSSVNLICSIQIFCPSHPPSLSWSWPPEHLLKDNVTQQHQNQTHLISDLSFTVSHRHHRANLTCTATHELQQRVQTHQTQTLHVQYAPTNTRADVDPAGSVVEGRSVTLSCSSDANPAVTYTWFRDINKTLKLLQTGPDLTINNTGPTDRGRYHCRAQNQHGTQNTSVLLDVQYAPTNTRADVDPAGSVVEGRSVTLSCSSDANPAVTYTWFRDINETLEPQQTGPDLTINNPGPADRGRYQCTAQNQHGTQNTSVLLDVQYAPKNTRADVDSAGSVVEGRSVTLSCSSDANPAVNYTWFRDINETLNPLQTGPDLTINNTNPTHSGRYHCRAQNQHGTQNTSVLLDVKFAPKISSSCSVNDIIHCVCEAHGNPLLKLEWRLSGSVQNNSADTSTANGTSRRIVLTVRQPLSASDVLQCFSSNPYGSASQQFQLITQTQHTGVHHESLLLGAAVGASVVTLLCVVTVCYERRKNRKRSETGGSDTSGLILTQMPVNHDSGDEGPPSAPPVTSESLLYSSIDFTKTEPPSEEIRGLSTLTDEYASIKKRSERDPHKPKQSQAEDHIYGNMGQH